MRTVTCLVAAALAIATATAGASSSKFFHAATQADFLKGEVENLSIDAQGRLVLGPATELMYDASVPFLWTLAAGADGSVFAGGGNGGKVFRIDAQGKASVFFDSRELEVHALAPAPGGGLYVATSPDGRIYQVDRSGAAHAFFDPDDKYIWALAVDAAGNVFAGTGERGIVYRITPDGTGAKFYDAKATHVTSLAFDRAGRLLVGTGSPGRVLRVDADGKGFVLLDSGYEEIRALRVDGQDRLYVAAMSGRPPAGGGAGSAVIDAAPAPAQDARPLTPSVSVEVTSIAIADASGGVTTTGPSRESRRASKGAVFRIDSDGLWDQIWDSRDDAPYDLVLAPDGALIVATGNRGKIYRLEGSPMQSMLLARGPAQQITSLLKDARGRLYYATANPGKLFRLSTERASRGTYESEPHDAQIVSTWGAISWRGTMSGSNRIELFTRSGNTETPDETWSPWSAAYTSPAGSPITSPKARYLQWRAVLTGRGDGPVLTSVSAAYLQRNLRPVVRSITLYPPGIVFQKPFSTGEPDLAGFEDQTTPERKLANAAAAAGGQSSSTMGRRTYQKGLQTLAWKADDENDDELSYDLFYRREGETNWKVLRRGVTDTILVWDTTTVPDGTYFVRVVASDAPSNPPAAALSGELDSAALEIDNTPPQIVVKEVSGQSGRTHIQFEVHDNHSVIQRVEYSLDGQRWTGVFPLDGVSDSKDERYELVLAGPIGERGVALRAIDAMNNVASGHVDAPAAR